MGTRRTIILGFTLLLGGLALSGTGLWLLLSPAQYEATVTIRVLQGVSDVQTYEEKHPGSYYDPYFIQPIFETIKSPLVLSNVAEALNLDVEWGKRYGNGKPLPTATTIKRLQQRMNTNFIRQSILIEISFCGDDPDETARIANAIGKAYSNYRVERRKRLAGEGIRALTDKYQQDEEQIRVLQTNVDSLREKYSIDKKYEVEFDRPDTLSQRFPITPEERDQRQTEYERTKPFWDEKRRLNNMIEFHKLFAEKIQAEKIDFQIPRIAMVEIIGAAEPPKFPVSPNRWLGVTLLAIGLFPIIGGLLLFKSSCRCSGT